MIEVYYWKDLDYIEIKYDFEDAKDKPGPEEFEEDYEKVPVDLDLDEDDYDNDIQILEKIFVILNGPENPLSRKKKQEWIKENLQPDPHTSMSIGDIVKVDDTYYICNDVGWDEIEVSKN